MKPFHLSGYSSDDLVCLREIASEHDEMTYDALRSYATHRRTHIYCGPMPLPVTKIANRRLWLRIDIELWMLPMSIPKFRRSRYSPP